VKNLRSRQERRKEVFAFQATFRSEGVIAFWGTRIRVRRSHALGEELKRNLPIISG
jgi:hypothetical protein